MNYTTLTTELLLDSLDRGYAGMTAVQAAANLNTGNRSRVAALSMREVREWAALEGRGGKIYAGTSDAALSDQQRNICYIIDQLMTTDGDGQLDPGNNLYVTMIDELVTARVISTSDRQALLDKATRSISRAAELGYPILTAGDIQRARSEIDQASEP